MGDVLSLIEQAERTMDSDEVAKSASRLMQGQFTLEDFLSQLRQVKKMGSLGGLMRLMPGMSKEMRQAAGQIDDGEVAKVEAIVCSMTPAERNDTSLMDGSRRSRVARGSGTTHPGRQHAAEAVQGDAEDDEGDGLGQHAQPPRHAEPVRDERPRRQKLAQQAAGAGLAGPGPGGAGRRLRHALPADGRRPGSCPRRSPGCRHRRARPARWSAVNKGTKKKKKGGRVTPPKGR